MKSITPDITVENCADALEYYQSLFGGEQKNVQKADGQPMFAGHEGRIIHSELHINDRCVIYLVDRFGEKGKGSNINLVLEMDSEEEINRLYSALSMDGSIQFELQKTFWGAHHAMVTDRFGVSWALNYTVR